MPMGAYNCLRPGCLRGGASGLSKKALRPVNLTLLTQRADPQRAYVGWQPIYEFEDVLLDAVSGRTVEMHRRTGRGARLGRFLGYHLPTQEIRERWSDGPAVLFISGMIPHALDVVRAIPRWRERFDAVIGYVVDSYYEKQLARLTPFLNEFDHLFVPLADTVEMIRSHTTCPVTALPFAGDVFTHGSASHERPIDLVAYGRQRSDLLEALQARFHAPGSGRTLIHSPIGRNAGTPRELRADRLMFWKLLRRTNLSINHDTDDAPSAGRHIPCAIITPRWFECLAAGCVIAGSLPNAMGARALFDWEDAVIELPHDATRAVDAVEAVLEDRARLQRARERNLREASVRHDWRHRVMTILETLNLEIPLSLRTEVDQLRARYSGAPVSRPLQAAELKRA